MLEVLKEYGWDYFTFMRQPSWIIDLAIQKVVAEARIAAKAQEQAKHAN